MSDTPIFDRIFAARPYERTMNQPNGKTSSGVGFFARVMPDITKYAPDPDLDGPLHLVGAQDADEVYIAPPNLPSRGELIENSPFDKKRLAYFSNFPTALKKEPFGELSADTIGFQPAEVKQTTMGDVADAMEKVEAERLKYLEYLKKNHPKTLVTLHTTHTPPPPVTLPDDMFKKPQSELWQPLGLSDVGVVEETQNPFRALLDGIYGEARAEIAREYPGGVITEIGEWESDGNGGYIVPIKGVAPAPVHPLTESLLGRLKLVSGPHGKTLVVDPDAATDTKVWPSEDGGRPKEIVLAQKNIGPMVFAETCTQELLDKLREEAIKNFPRHTPTTVESKRELDGTVVVLLLGVESALPIYTPLFEGDVNEE